MRSLDKFYKYLENHEAGETEEERAAAEAAGTDHRRTKKPASGSRAESRYVIRNGVTVAVAREETSPKQVGPVPKDDSLPPDESAAPQVTPDDPDHSEDGAIWRGLPENVRRLAQLSSDILPDAAPQDPERRQLIERLLNPLLSLEDTARLLGVCTATVRRYANKGTLAHHRTIGQQRRFLLSDVLALLESRKPVPEHSEPAAGETP